MAERGVKAFLLAGVAAPVLFAGSGAYAQDAGSTEPPGSHAAGAVQEVIVTARRREENIQSVPLAVTALTGEELREQGVLTPSDLQTAVPSLSMNANRNHQNSNYSIRGLSQGGVLGTETVVAYFSEVPGPTATAAGNAGAGHALYDMSSVQVLKGPQGTLFGRTATAGAILFTPRHPEFNKVSGFIDGVLNSVGGDALGGSEITAGLNVPIVADHLAARIAINRRHQDGYTSIIGGGSSPEDETNSVAARLGIEFAAGPFRNYAVYDYFKSRETAAAVQIAGANPGLYDRYASLFPSSLTPFLQGLRDRIVAEDLRVRSSDDAKREIGASQYPNINRAETHTLIDVAELSGDFSFGTLSLKNIFGYQRYRGITALDNGNLGIVVSGYGAGSSTIVNGEPIFGVGPFFKFYTDEVQLNGELWDSALQFTLGYYYQWAPLPHNRSGSTNIYTYVAGLFSGGGFTSAYPFNLDGGAKETAVYGQGTFDLGRVGLRGVHFTAGYRDTRDKQTQVTEGFTVAGGNLAPTGVITRPPALKSSGKGWTLALDYQPTDDLTLYATTRRGYKPGGRNSLAGVGAGHPTYGSETVQDYELGAKWKFETDALFGHVYADVYRMDYKDIQRPILLFGASFVDNVAAARLEGFELEGAAATHGGFEVDAWYSLNKANYTSWFAADPLSYASTNIDLSNNPFPNAPKHKASVTARYTQDLADRGEVIGSVTAYYQSRTWFDDAAQRNIDVFSSSTLFPWGPLSKSYIVSALSQPAYTVINARIDWKRALGDNVDAAVFVNNLTDKVYATGGTGGLGQAGYSVKTYAPPRIIGVELKYHFGE